MNGQIQEYYLEHKLVFEEKFSIVLQNFDVDAIHKMRTTTKRLRGLFQLIQVLSEKKFKAKKQLRKIRNLFKYAGKIREIQIEQLLVYELEERLNRNFAEYREYLLIRENKEINLFLNTIPEFTEENQILNNEKILQAIESINPDTAKVKAQKFVDKKTRILKKLNSKVVSNTRIHQNRTILKQIYYLYDILLNLTGREVLMDVTKERMKEIEQLIGSWHDKLNSFFYLNAFFKTKNGRKTAKYKLLKTRIVEDRDIMRQEIVGILRNKT